MDFNKKEMPIQGFTGFGGGATGSAFRSADGERTYIDELFAMTIFTGNDTDNRDIVNGIDLANEGGLVWSFVRNIGGRDNTSYDTARGAFQMLKIQAEEAEFNYQPHDGGIKQWNDNGYRLESGGGNNSGENYISYTFRKAEKFFDIVTYTGNGSNRTISHNLKSVPGAIIIKKRNAGSTGWMVYHQGMGNTKYMTLNQSSNPVDDDTVWNDTTPTASVFSVGTHTGVNANNDTYVAYIFAHDEDSFGVDGDASIIKCGSYTGNGADGFNANAIDLGFEPQFVLIRNASNNEQWVWHNMALGIPGRNQNSRYHKSSASTEVTDQTRLMVNARGFSPTYGSGYLGYDWNKNGDTYIYWAIRRPDGIAGKPIETGTDVLALDYGSGSSTIPNFDSGFPVDWAWIKNPTSSFEWYNFGRLFAKNEMQLQGTNALGGAGDYTFDSTSGWGKGQDTSSVLSWMFRRYAGFDVVHYEGAVSGNNYHSLGQAPEMGWFKQTNSTNDWFIYHNRMRTSSGNDWASGHFYMKLNATDARVANSFYFMGGDGTDTTFEISTSTDVNGANNKYMAFLFASVEGVSKVGWYTGTGADQTITTGFQPRMAFIKRADVGDNGWILDTTRGWGSGNDNGLAINSSGAQTNADFGAPTATGFTVKGTNSGTNTDTGHYIYWAHA